MWVLYLLFKVRYLVVLGRFNFDFLELMVGFYLYGIFFKFMWILCGLEVVIVCMEYFEGILFWLRFCKKCLWRVSYGGSSGDGICVVFCCGVLVFFCNFN